MSIGELRGRHHLRDGHRSGSSFNTNRAAPLHLGIRCARQATSGKKRGKHLRPASDAVLARSQCAVRKNAWSVSALPFVLARQQDAKPGAAAGPGVDFQRRV